jgi:hypothetical protein
MICQEGGFATNKSDRSTADASASRWAAFLVKVERAVAGRGAWEGEARDIRDAAGIRRFRHANWSRVAEQLAERGLEVDPARQPYESEPVRIRPAGAADWEASGRILAARLADAERRVPSIAVWREEVVLETAIGEWIGLMRRGGWVLRRPETPK